MKTSTFKKRVEELGYTAIGDTAIDIHPRDKTEELSAYVAGRHRFSVYIYDNVTPELFNLLVEYARTPLEERKDEKKYRLRVAYGDTYLMKNPRNDELYVGTKGKYIDRELAEFTASEIAELEKKYSLDSFKREEVIEDE